MGRWEVRKVTAGEILAVCGFLFSVIGRVGLWYKKTWGWAIGTLGAVAWLAWGVLIALNQPGSGGWILLGNDSVFLALGLIGWWIWAKEDRNERATKHD